jgi:hypothetical protein
MKVGSYILFSSFLLLITSCEGGLRPIEYKKAIEEDKNLIKVREIGTWTFDLKYVPTDYLILKNANGQIIDRQWLSKQQIEKGNLQYFEMRISSNDGKSDALAAEVSSKEDYFDRINYLSFEIQRDVNGQVNGREIPCVLSHFDRTYGLGKDIVLALAFPVDLVSADDFTIQFNATKFNSGLLKFHYDTKDIKGITPLKI